MEDMTDKAMGWVSQQKALAPDKPFFVYFAPGATHAPHHVPDGMGGQIQGQVRPGLGQAARGNLRPAEGARRHPRRIAQLTARHAEIPAWDDMPEAHEAGAAPPDGGVCRLHGIYRPPCRTPARRPRRSSTSSTTRWSTTSSATTARRPRARSTAPITRWPTSTALPALETPEFLTERLDKLGGPDSYNHYAVGWAHAMNTPYQWTKQVASHWGGTRNGTIVHWPKRHQGEGRNPLAVPPRHRRGADDSRGGGAARAGLGQRRASASDRRRQHAVLVQRRQRRGAARDAVFRNVRQPRHLPQRLDRGDQARDAVGARGPQDRAARR